MKDTKEFLQTGQIGVFDIPEGETRYTTNGLTYEEAIENFQRYMPEGYDARDYVRINENGKLECKVLWDEKKGIEWVEGDVITQIRKEFPNDKEGIEAELLGMFTPIEQKVIDSPDWAFKEGGEKGEMYKPEMKNVQAVEYTGNNKAEILAHFGEQHKLERGRTFVIREDKTGDLLVCSLEKGGGKHDGEVEGGKQPEVVERQALEVGKILREGGKLHELYTNREKDFIKTKAVLNEEKTEQLAKVVEQEVEQFKDKELNDKFRQTEAYEKLSDDCKKTLDDIDGVEHRDDENHWGSEQNNEAPEDNEPKDTGEQSEETLNERNDVDDDGDDAE